MKRFISCTAMVCACIACQSQTNLQVFYDFGKDRKQITTTFEMFKADHWGNTFFFIDHDFRTRDSHPSISAGNEAPCGTYFEIARGLNFWQDSGWKDVSLHVEYNGGIYDNYYVNNAWLVGIDYFMHSADYRQTLTLQLLYKSIAKTTSDVPLQLTAVWNIKDLLGVHGLVFSGFADFWWQDHVAFHDDDFTQPLQKPVTFLSEPQLWYRIGQHVGCDNLHIGTEVELTTDFGTYDGFRCNPCIGVKWEF